jgi:hypothetical protein
LPCLIPILSVTNSSCDVITKLAFFQAKLDHLEEKLKNECQTLKALTSPPASDLKRSFLTGANDKLMDLLRKVFSPQGIDGPSRVYVTIRHHVLSSNRETTPPEIMTRVDRLVKRLRQGIALCHASVQMVPLAAADVTALKTWSDELMKLA